MLRKCLLLLLLPVSYSLVMAQNTDTTVLNRFAFGSCAFHFAKQRIWNSVLRNNPQLWVWLGDNIYSETLDVTERQEDYSELGNNRNYQRLVAHNPVIATWDDHDYGYNDCGTEFPMKEESKRLFLEFFKVPHTDARWKQNGIYTSHTYGTGDRKVRFIILDLRYNREKPGPDADMMGAEQWKWLEQELRGNDARITVFASSVQFIGIFYGFENWSSFPASQKRMLDLIRDTGTKGAVFISGDVHFGQLSMRKYDQVSYPIYDLTSSGLTHGNMIVGWKHPYQVDGSRFGYRNFGMVRIDWVRKLLSFDVRNIRDKVKYSWDIPFSAIGQQ